MGVNALKALPQVGVEQDCPRDCAGEVTGLMSEHLFEYRRCGAAYPPEQDHHCVEGKLDDVRDAINELKKTIEGGRELARSRRGG